MMASMLTARGSLPRAVRPLIKRATAEIPGKDRFAEEFPLHASGDPANSATYVRVSALVCRVAFLGL